MKDNYQQDAWEAHYPEGACFLWGGGNCGDLCGEYGLRLRGLDHFKARMIGPLPQSIHFRQPSELERMARTIAAHGDFHLMVRDSASYEIAKASFNCYADLAPDAA
jgi:pyruvyl transferase EpsO